MERNAPEKEAARLKFEYSDKAARLCGKEINRFVERELAKRGTQYRLADILAFRLAVAKDVLGAHPDAESEYLRILERTGMEEKEIADENR